MRMAVSDLDFVGVMRAPVIAVFRPRSDK